jgi:predicted DNA-binding transcriptional regulator YafY
MDQTARLHKIKLLLEANRAVSKQKLLDSLEVSWATLKRDLRYLRESLNTPIEHDAEAGGYRLTKSPAGPSHELPGMWFNADEIHALLTMQQLLEKLQPGLLTPHVNPLLDRLNRLLGSAKAPSDQVRKRIRVFRVNARIVNPNSFAPISAAVLNRRRLEISHFHRRRNCTEMRTVSPQRLIYYRDNWYLDAWCHLRDDVRSFALDAIEKVRVLNDAAIDIPDEELDAIFTAGYGIFSGKDVQWAVLRFSPERARWVSKEVWHPQQQGEFEADGNYVLRVPYSDERELVMDILRHVPEVGVVGPSSLIEKVKAQLENGLTSMKNA